MPNSLNGTYTRIFMDKQILCACLQYFDSLVAKGLPLWAAYHN